MNKIHCLTFNGAVAVVVDKNPEKNAMRWNTPICKLTINWLWLNGFETAINR